MNAYRERYELMIAANVGAELADKNARLSFPAEAAEWDKEQSADAQRNANIAEKREQQVITMMARAIGFEVYSLSQARAAKQSPGLPDQWFAHMERAFAGWFESKRQVGGKRSSAQIAFGEQCVAAKIPYGFGDRYEFAKWLTQHGFTPPPIPQD